MKFILTIIILLNIFTNSFAIENDFFSKAKKLFDNEKLAESKFLFQRNIVYNPKHANSYLYLAKIFGILEDKKKQEKYINTSLLLDPKNEEAMYMLIEIELERSNFSRVDELKREFQLICSNMCTDLTSIEDRLKEFENTDAS
tara:strand:+ start:69 stop:497 length:429 start_codon:yes stop_codon:yes gene_type:complete